MNYTLLLVAITVVVSFLAFKNRDITNRLIFYPRVMDRPSEFHRAITHGFIHADEMHLIFNMIALYFIGRYVESYFLIIGKHGLYPILYLSGIVFSSLPSYAKNKNNPSYAALGASGGVAAVIFAMVYISPWEKISVMFIPMWSIVFAILYVVYSVYMSKKANDNIGHEAHLWGAIYGFVFTLLFDSLPGKLFLSQILNPPF
jgi:membrane associated rhomboid family serine protease